MTVYVDDMRMEAKVGNFTAKWSHLTADTSDELIEFALTIGLKESWIQYPGTWKEHFDVTESKRQLAIKNGAKEIGYLSKEAQILMRKKQEEDEAYQLKRRKNTKHGLS